PGRVPGGGAAMACPARGARAAPAGLCRARPAAAGGDAEEPSWLEGPYATGTWGGGRTWLEDNGLHIDLIYTGEVLNRLAGGSGARTAYRGNVDLVFTVDTGKLRPLPRGHP